MPTSRLLAVLAICNIALSSSSAHAALGNPTVRVTLQHAPSYQLKLGKITFRATGGECADMLVDRLTATFSEGGITVVDRENFDALLAEHRLNLSGLIDQQTVAEMGKMLGVDAIFELRTTRCTTHDPGPLWRHPRGLFGIEDKKRTEFGRKVTGSMVGSIKTVDLKTGRIFKSQSLNVDAGLETWSAQGNPEPPDPNQVTDALILKAHVMVHRMFFPWTETVELHFFDDDEYNLKAAFVLFKSGQFERALAQSKTSLAAAEADPKQKTKQLRHAVYNVGMCLYAMEDFDGALPFFQKAVTFEAGQYEPETLASCEKAATLKKSFQEYEQKVALSAPAESGPGVSSRPVPSRDASPTPAPTSTRPALSTVERLKNLDDLLKKGLITQAEYSAKRAEILKEM